MSTSVAEPQLPPLNSRDASLRISRADNMILTGRIGDCVMDQCWFAPSVPCREVEHAFQEDPKLLGIPILDNGAVAGLVMRDKLFMKLGQRYGFQLFHDRLVSNVMDEAPLVVGSDTSLATVVSAAMNRSPERLYDHILVTRDGSYAGVVTVRRLLESVSEHHLAWMERRDKVLEAIATTSERLMGSRIEDMQACDCEMVARLGQALGVSHAYVYENGEDRSGDRVIKLHCDWVAPGTPAHLSDHPPHQWAFDEHIHATWVQALSHGNPVYGHVRDFQPAERPFVVVPETKSVLLMPILVADEWWGVLGFEDRIAERDWSNAEVDALQTAARLIGASVRYRQSEQFVERLAAAVEEVADAILITNCDGTIEYVNQAFEHITGYSREEVLGRHPRLLKSTQDNSDGHAKLWETVTSGEVWRGQLVNRRKDGRDFLADVTISPVRDRSGKIMNYVGVERDVTEAAALQERLRDMEKMTAVGQLAAGIAHDFNNLLTAVTGNAELMLMRGERSAFDRELLQTILEQGHRAAHLIRQILDFSRKSISEKRPLDIIPLLKETIKLLRRTLPETIHVRLEIDPGDYVVKADLPQIQQAITNLALNARDAMPDGGELRFCLSRLVVEPTETSPLPEVTAGTWIALTVSDTGGGISPDVLPHIFEPFFTTKRVGAGTGLGLAQVYGIVTKHGGELDVKSQVGQGSSFTIYLPAEEIEPVEETERNGNPLPLGHGENLLVVEDDAQVRGTVEAMLTHLGYQVTTAPHGKEALVRYDQQNGGFDLVLTDMTMPEMGGLALSQALKSKSPAVRVVVMSGYPLGEATDDWKSEGIVDWLQKPPTLPLLAESVANALRNGNGKATL